MMQPSSMSAIRAVIRHGGIVAPPLAPLVLRPESSCSGKLPHFRLAAAPSRRAGVPIRNHLDKPFTFSLKSQCGEGRSLQHGHA